MMQSVPDATISTPHPTPVEQTHFKQLVRIWRNEGAAALREQLDELGEPSDVAAMLPPSLSDQRPN
jgi:hypothetical protein